MQHFLDYTTNQLLPNFEKTLLFGKFFFRVLWCNQTLFLIV